MVNVTRSHQQQHAARPSKLLKAISSLLFFLAVIVITWSPENSVENFALLRYTDRRGLSVGNVATADMPSPSSDITYSPFPDMQGEHYQIYHPFYHNFNNSDSSVIITPLLASPEQWTRQLTQRYEWLDARTHGYQETPHDRAVTTYLEMLKQHVIGYVFGGNEKSIPTDVTKPKGKLVTLHPELRDIGYDWPYLGVTMTGRKRLDNVEELIRKVAKESVEGDYVETGVWRGGSSILARAVFRSLEQGHRRSFVCDSFRGLPPGDKKLDEKDQGWDNAPYLEVSDEQVATNFREAGVMDPNVVFVKGFFNETMRPLASKLDKISIMRLDGDMYESTVDVLYHLYEKVSLGGFVIMDDWDGFPSKRACLHFFAVHNHKVNINRIDQVSVYWQKTEEVKVQYWRYEQDKFFDKEEEDGGQDATRSSKS